MSKVAVYRLLDKRTSQKTVLWVSERVVDQLGWYEEKKEQHKGFFMRKLERYAIDGFGPWIGNKAPIRPEWKSVYRIGHDSTLFRVIGFFAGGNQSEFIAVDAYLKSGTALSSSERARIDIAASIRATGSWERKEAE